MKLLVFDSDEQRCEAHAKTLRQLGHAVIVYQNNRLEMFSDNQPVSVGVTSLDLIFRHDNITDNTSFTQQCESGKLIPGKTPTVFYGGAGSTKANGVPWAVDGRSPLSEEWLKRILSAAEMASLNSWDNDLRQLWSGIPETLLAWVLAKLIGDESIASQIPIDPLRRDFAQLKRSAGDKAQNLVWDELNVAASLAHAKQLIQLVRVDV